MREKEPYTIYLRTLPSGKQIYYFRFRYSDGTRSPSYSCGTNKLGKAKAYCQRLYNQGAMVRHSKILFRDYAENFFDDDSKFLSWKRANGNELAQGTVEAYRKKLFNQLLPFFGGYQLVKITEADVQDWVIWATDKWSRKTINSAQGVLHIIFKQAKSERIIKEIPTDGIELRKLDRKKPVLLTIEEIKGILKERWTSESHRMAFFVACMTGMRIGEVCAMKNKDVHEDFLDVKTTISDARKVGKTKTGLCRIVPIPPKVSALIKGEDEWTFGGDKPIIRRSVYGSFCRCCDKVGIQREERGVTIHSMRKFFISYLQNECIAEPKIRAVVGHSDVTMTDLYTVWKKEMFEEVYKAQEKLFNELQEAL